MQTSSMVANFACWNFDHFKGGETLDQFIFKVSETQLFDLASFVILKRGGVPVVDGCISTPHPSIISPRPSHFIKAPQRAKHQSEMSTLLLPRLMHRQFNCYHWQCKCHRWQGGKPLEGNTNNRAWWHDKNKCSKVPVAPSATIVFPAHVRLPTHSGL